MCDGLHVPLLSLLPCGEQQSPSTTSEKYVLMLLKPPMNGRADKHACVLHVASPGAVTRRAQIRCTHASLTCTDLPGRGSVDPDARHKQKVRVGGKTKKERRPDRRQLHECGCNTQAKSQLAIEICTGTVIAGFGPIALISL